MQWRVTRSSAVSESASTKARPTFEIFTSPAGVTYGAAPNRS